MRIGRSALVFFLLGLVACGKPGNPAAPSSALTETTETAHFVFHFARGDVVDAPRQEAFHDWFVQLFGLAISRRIEYRKYFSRTELQAETGLITNGFADPPTYTVHSIWPWDAHEPIHVYTATFGRPTDFFNEGIAVGLSTDPFDHRLTALWNSQPIDDIARALLRAGRLPAVSDMAETMRFRAIDDQVSYPVSGSFMRFLVDTYGVDRTKAFFASGSRDDALARITAIFPAAYGVSLDEAERLWRQSLDDR